MEVKKKIRQILIEHSKTRNTVTYTDLVNEAIGGKSVLQPIELASLLREISTEENFLGRGMLSAVVVHSKGNQMPGSGFFRLANDLGRETTNKRKFWLKEIAKVYKEWSRQ